jgi:glycosyltransferase involved in cell wall biosynthesis
MTATLVSIVIRTLNEARYLGELLEGIASQQTEGLEVETVLVDSGSTDGTLAIAEKHGCVITHITREEFSFGRSLNRGCEIARGEVLVLVSGHCVPRDRHWLKSLCQPVIDGLVDYSYGKQIGGSESRYSECRIFAKYFPDQSRIPQEGFFCNNANSAIARKAWAQYRFDEDVTGLEDMELAQRLCQGRGRIGYVAEACVYHHHAESWSQVQRRFEREALALQKIMPQIHVRHRDAIRYIFSSIWHDWRCALREGIWLRKAWPVVLYRLHQYTGSFKGNREHRKLSHAEKDKYFYPH